LMDAAQPYLNLTQQLPADPSQPMTQQQADAFLQLLVGIGTGIGNVTAHEIAHQFELPDADCDRPADTLPAGPPCPGLAPHTYFYEYWQSETPQFTHVGSPLQWTPDDSAALRRKFLSK